jgi:hypothetical protein
MRKSVGIPLGLLLSIGVGTAFADSGAAEPYCRSHAGFDQFDFWLGEWEVYAGQDFGQLVGNNRIERNARGCVVEENWLNTGGTDGVSLRYFDPATESWKMFWVSDGYSVETEGGQLEPGVMLLEGNIHYFADEFVTGFRVRFTANGDGTVRQFAEQLDPKTSEWVVWFDGLYRKTKDKETN